MFSNYAKYRVWLKRLFWVIVVALIVYAFSVITGPKVGSTVQALTPPKLPAQMQVSSAEQGTNNQNWSWEMSDEFHFKSQGTQTVPIPLSWFLALEQPGSTIVSTLLFKQGAFSDKAFLSRMGFVPTEKSENNPHDLPVGFAVSPLQHFGGLEKSYDAIGFTCAACHTGQLIYNNERYIVEGGASMIDIGLFVDSIGTALALTAVSNKLPLLGGRFDRFAKKVLKTQYSDSASLALAKDLEQLLGRIASAPGGRDVTDGFARLDALSGIGNQVFSANAQRPQNYVNPNAPVNYPHLWTSSWFDWVQYDGSIMQPLVRNVGEAMGVAATTNFSAPLDGGRFSSVVPIKNLHWIEQSLAGSEPPAQVKAFSGLRAPKWPDAFPKIDRTKANQGRQLYDKLCAQCHLPALTREVADGSDPDNPFWDKKRGVYGASNAKQNGHTDGNWGPIVWYDNGVRLETKDDVLHVKIIPLDKIGTDPAQGNVLTDRVVDTAGIGNKSALENTKGMGIDIDVCANSSNFPAYQDRLDKTDRYSEEVPKRLVNRPVKDGPFVPFPYALGAVVQQNIDAWFDDNQITGAGRIYYESDRPNCLQADQGYKARPLNGVWATAPFLHNGSVPTLMDLLGAPEDRPDRFVLGDPTFDPVNVGFKNTDANGHAAGYNDDGYFVVDTHIPGNLNTGHEFRDEEGSGRVGPALSVEDREAIIEFLKTI